METAGDPIGWAAIDAAANVVPLTMLAAAVHALLKAHVMARPVPVQMVAQAGLAFAFATTWYALVLVMLAFFAGVRGRSFAVSGFSGPAFTWQVLQGLVVYATIAATCYATRGGREAASVTIVSMPPLERYPTRTGDEIVPISLRSSTSPARRTMPGSPLAGRHLVRMSLAEFARRLYPLRFVRVHRDWGGPGAGDVGDDVTWHRRTRLHASQAASSTVFRGLTYPPNRSQQGPGLRLAPGRTKYSILESPDPVLREINKRWSVGSA